MNAQQEIENNRPQAATKADFRLIFSRMASDALIDREELAELLATTPGAISMMLFKGKLPPKAFPEWRRSVWFVGDIRNWLKEEKANRPAVTAGSGTLPESPAKANPARPRTGRRRKDTAIF